MDIEVTVSSIATDSSKPHKIMQSWTWGGSVRAEIPAIVVTLEISKDLKLTASEKAKLQEKQRQGCQCELVFVSPTTIVVTITDPRLLSKLFGNVFRSELMLAAKACKDTFRWHLGLLRT